MESKPNPELYERLSAPFESEDEARAAVEAFCEKIAQLREQYKIPDVSLTISVTVKTDDGEEREMTGGRYWGDDAKALIMVKREADSGLATTA